MTCSGETDFVYAYRAVREWGPGHNEACSYTHDSAEKGMSINVNTSVIMMKGRRRCHDYHRDVGALL